MVNLKNTQTEKNLYRALTGEALAHLKYEFYKSQLSKEYKQYEPLLDEIIHNEKEHGKIWFKLLNDGMPTNKENLLDAIKGESFEHEDMYPTFSRIAEEEGFFEIAELFKLVGEIEGRHSIEFKNICSELDNAFESLDMDTEWKCLNCGYTVAGDDAPFVCPVCNHEQKYFKRL